MNVGRKKPKAKGKNGKEGSLMDVVTDPDYGRDTRGEAKERISMNSGKRELPNSKGKLLDANGNEINAPKDTGEKLTKEEFQYINEAMSKKIKEIKSYNEYLYHLEPKYKELELFNGMVLVRLKRIPSFQEVEIAGEKSEIYIPIQATKPNPADPTGREGMKVDHPYPYTNVGVVVSSDSDKLSAGDTVQLTRKAMNFHWNLSVGEWEWANAFYHHADGLEYRGYVLIREYDIEAKLNERV